MTLEFLGPTPWTRISAVARTREPKLAAVAFLGADAPKMLRSFGRGDVLVVNASKEAVGSHATSPDAIREFRDRGVDVRTSARLHAKVIATSTHAVVGSANASMNSQASIEAAVVVDQKKTVREIREFVKSVAADSTPITDELLAALDQVWAEARRRLVPGVTGVSAEDGLLPRGPLTVRLIPTEDDDLTLEEREEIESTVEFDPEFPIEAFQIDDNGTNEYKTGDVLLRHAGGSIWVPAVVYSVRMKIPGRESGYIQLIRMQRNHRNRRLTAVRKTLSAKELSAFDAAVSSGSERKLRVGLAHELLAVWKLKPRS